MRRSPLCRSVRTPRRLFGTSLQSLILACVVISQPFLVSPASADDNLPPVITDFGVASVFGYYYELSGYVEDENPSYCIIAFGGCTDGAIAYVDEDGFFSTIVYLGPGEWGVTTAETIDDWGEPSNVATDFVTPH